MSETCGIVIKSVPPWRFGAPAERICGQPATYEVEEPGKDAKPTAICASCAKKLERALMRGEFKRANGTNAERGEFVLTAALEGPDG